VTLMRGGGVAWRGEYGVADVRRQIRVTDSTMFEACSMSKPVFAALVFLLAREGKIDLDRPLSRYLDERELFSQMSYKLITARMVLSHTSGLPNWRKGNEEWGGPLPVMFSPGSAFLYSGEGYYYLQRVVEKITGEALEHCAARMLFRPLGMRHASYVWTDGVEGTLASGHTVGGQFKERTHYRRANAAYTLYVSAADYGRFLAEFLRRPDDPGRLFGASLVDSMFATRVRVVIRDPIERPGKARGTGVFWCLGWSVNTSEEGEIAHHSGSNGSGFRCFSQFDRGRGTGLVIMTNGAGGGDLWTRLVGVIGDW
jgi:CubicO group peptidase (beta-lactamase class C family)